MYSRELDKLKNLSSVVPCLEGYGIYIAGGAITSVMTNKDVNDIDLYFKDEKAFTAFVALWLSGEFGFNRVVSVTDKSLTLHDTSNEILVQAVYYKWFPSPEDVFKDFDFTINMGLLDLSNSEFHFHENFFKHNSQRYIDVNTNTAYPILTALRLDKYSKRGYYVSKQQFLKVMLSILNLDVKDWSSLKNHIGGMYGLSLEDVFDVSKPFSLKEAIKQIEGLDVECCCKDVTKEVAYKDIENSVLEKVSKEAKEILSEEPYHSWFYFKTYDSLFNLLEED